MTPQRMRCMICGQGDTQPGTATLVLEREGRTVIVKHVPARVCENCGEEYVDEAAAAAALDNAERAVRGGAGVVIRE